MQMIDLLIAHTGAVASCRSLGLAQAMIGRQSASADINRTIVNRLRESARQSAHGSAGTNSSGSVSWKQASKGRALDSIYYFSFRLLIVVVVRDATDFVAAKTDHTQCLDERPTASRPVGWQTQVERR